MEIINCLIKKEIKQYEKEYKKETVIIEVNISLLNYNLTVNEKNELFDLGYNNTIEYLKKNFRKFTLNCDIQDEIIKYLK